MPGGPVLDNPESYVAFVAIKLVGYSVAAVVLNKHFEGTPRNPLIVGTVRTLIGMVFGAIVGIVGFWQLDLAVSFFLFALVPVRILEWWIVLRLFYWADEPNRNKFPYAIALACVWSFILDIPAIIGFIATGGFWIC